MTSSLLFAQDSENASFKNDPDFKIAKAFFDQENFNSAIPAYEKAATIFQQAKDWDGYFRCRVRIAESKASLQKITEAKEIALEIEKEAPRYLPPDDTNLALTYNILGVCAYHERDCSAAAIYFNKYLNIQEKKKSYEDVVTAFNNMAACFQQQQNIVEGKKYYKRALEVQMEKVGVKEPLTAQIMHNLGSAYLEIGVLDSAALFIEKSLHLRRAIYETDNQFVAESLGSWGHVKEVRYEYDSAQYYFNQALNIEQEVYGDTSTMVARSYNRLGAHCLETGKYIDALDYFQKAMEVFKAIPEATTRGGQFQIADTYNNIGVIHEQMGQGKLGLEYLQESLRIFKIVFPEGVHRKIASVYNNQGACYNLQADFEKALANYQEAKRIWQLLIDQGTHPRKSLVHANNNIGETYRHDEQFEEAINHYQLALSILEDLEPDPHYTGALYNNLGIVYALQNNNTAALEAFQIAQEHWQTIYTEPNLELLSNFNNLGKVYHADQDYTTALHWFQQALFRSQQDTFTNLLTLPKEIPSSYKTMFLDLLYNKAQTLAALDRSHKIAGLETLDLADQLLDQLRKTFVKDRIEIGRTGKKIYALAIHLCDELYANNQEKHYHQKAFYYAEKAKAFSLLLQVLENEALLQANLPEDLQQREKALSLAIFHFQKNLSNDPDNSEIRKKLFDKERAYEQLLMEIEKSSEKYYQLRYYSEIKNLETIQKEVIKADQTMLSYFVGKDQLYAFVITPSDFQVIKIKKDFPLNEWVNQLNQGIYAYWLQASSERNEALFEESLQNYQHYAHALYQKLIQPIAERIALPDRWIILPDDALNYISFASLLSEPIVKDAKFSDYPYLIKKASITYCYSANLLADMQGRVVHPTRDWAGFAPAFNGTENTPFRTIDEYRRSSLGRLLNNQSEVERIASYLGGDTYLGEEASLHKFLDRAEGYKILHLATHAKADNLNPEASFIAFQAAADSLDSFLKLSDLYQLDLNAEMVVLSACETGFGKLLKGEGIANFARAFIAARAKNINVTLWNSHDQSTPWLMYDFYHQLQNQLTKDQALQASQLAFLHNKIQVADQNTNLTNRMRHPFFWSGFITIGDVSPLDLKSANSPIIWSLLAFLFLVIIFVWIRRK